MHRNDHNETAELQRLNIDKINARLKEDQIDIDLFESLMRAVDFTEAKMFSCENNISS